MLVSIITVFYNRENLVDKTIDSLLNQTHKDLEIIAVNDGSTDNTLGKLREIKDSRLKILNHENWGFTKSIKHAVESTTSGIIAIHGSGDYSYPTRIEKQLSLILSDERLGAIGCHLENINTKSNESSIRYINLNPDNDQLQEMLNRSFFTHGEVMFRKSYYEKVGGYREFFSYAQDRDLWLRISMYAKFDAVDEVLYRRYNLTDGVSGSYEKSLLQLYYSEMAIQSIKMRLDEGFDYVDKFGDDAKFLIEKDRKVSNKIAFLSMRAFREQNLDDSKFILKKSRAVKLTRYNLIISLLPFFASLNGNLYKITLKLLSKLKKIKNKRSENKS